MTFNKPKTNGFSLIEVMIAVLVLSVGILAVSKLQTSLIRSGSDANQRSVAAGIVQKKIDDLRRFAYVNTSATLPALPEWEDLSIHALTSLKYPNSLSFANIATNQGGRMQAGTIFNGNNTYELSWTSDSYYYNGTNQIATTDAVTLFPAFKTAHVKVTWQGVGDNTTSVVSFDTVIDAYNLANTDLGGAIPAGGSSPIVAYEALDAPDVVPVELGIGDLKKETSKPLPDVSKKGDSTMVKFETVTYNTNNKTQRREEFRTLACNCTQQSASPSTSVILGYVTWDKLDSQIIDITTTVPKSITKTGVVTGGAVQDDACTICCRDGDDVTSTGTTTFKVCRLKRIDGVLRIIDPWKLVAFNMIPASYFNDDDGLPSMNSSIQSENISRYSNYVTTTVRNILGATGSPSAFADHTAVDSSFIDETSTFTNNPGGIDHLHFTQHLTTNDRNIQVRGVYMDYPPSGIFTKITNQSTYYSASNVPLDRVPFYEVNLTQLAGWVPDVWNNNDSTVSGDVVFDDDYTDNHDTMDGACIPIHSASGYSRNYITNEQFHEEGTGVLETCHNASRGEFHPISPTSAEEVTSRIYTSSDGIVDRNITGNTTVDISLDLQVD